jgi:LPS sulfotransferase NodH
MAPVVPPFVTVVSGAPRSGTSLMMRMLAAGGIEPLTDGLRAPDRDNPYGYFEFEPVKRTREDSAWVAGAAGRAVKMVHLLLRDLPAGPEYRVLLMRRKLDEMVASQRRMLERLGRDPGPLSDERRIAIFRAQLDECEAWLATQPSFRVLRVDYNALVEDPAPWLTRVAEFLGAAPRAGAAGLDLAAMTACIDTTLYRNRA